MSNGKETNQPTPNTFTFSAIAFDYNADRTDHSNTEMCELNIEPHEMVALSPDTVLRIVVPESCFEHGNNMRNCISFLLFDAATMLISHWEKIGK